MSNRRRLALGGALVAAILAVLGAVLLGPGEGLLGGRLGGGPDDPLAEILGGSGATTDASVRGAGATMAFDGGLAFAVPLEWLPTATVTADRSSAYGTLTGRVVSSGDGEGIAGAELVFEREGTTTSARSGAGGAFALAVSAEGRYVLAIATAEGYLPFAPEWGHSPIAFVAHRGQRIDGAMVHLVPAVDFLVTVVDGSDAAVEGATVQLADGSAGERAMAPVQASYTTDADGRARIEAWDGALVEATHPERGRGRALIGQRAQLEHEVRITLRVSETSSDESIGGVVLDQAGEPVEGAVVRAYLQQRGLHRSGQAASGPDGRFELDGLDPGPHALVADHPAHPDAYQRGVQTGRRDVVLRLEGGHAVEGRVVDAEGRPVPAFNIAARRARGALMRETIATMSSYDAEGRFLMTGLSVGTFELIATSRGYPPSAPVPLTIGDSAPSPVTLTLERGGRMEGVVRSSDGGRPIAGARVSFEARLGRGSSASPVLATSVSREDGSYTLDGVGDSLRSLHVTAEGHHARILSGFTVAPGATLRMDIELTEVADGEEPHTELAGIGATLFPHGDTLLIRGVVEGGGAQAAGLGPGDSIVAVDGTPVTTLGFGGSLDRIRGPEGRTVVLTVKRRGEETATDIAITRRRVRT